MANQEQDTASSRQVIVHVDMDCFFVAVERIKDPGLVGKPVIVGGDPQGRGVVSSASYEAREFGVHSAMPASRAMTVCPDAVFLKGSFDDYDDYSRRVRKILEQYTPLVEMASIDEAYLDLTGTQRLFGSPMETVASIKHRIFTDTGLVASFGVASNKLVAKIASDYGKPNGITWILPGEEAAFLAPMEIRALPGIGPRMEERLKGLDIATAGDLAAYNVTRLASGLGDHTRARNLHARALGESRSAVVPERERKSISKEITFREDIQDQDYLTAVLHYLSEQVALKLRSIGKRASTITCKYRYPDFETHTRSQSLEAPTDLAGLIADTAEDLFTRDLDLNAGVRLIGVGVSNLREQDRQTELFANLGSRTKRESDRESAIEQVRRKFGFDAVLSGQSIKLIGHRKSSEKGEKK